MKDKRRPQLLKLLEASKKRIAAERDKMRALVDEYEEILESSGRAEDRLQEALDALSEYL